MGRRVAATPRPRRGYGPSRGDAAAATWTYERDRRASHRYLATFSVYALGGAGSTPTIVGADCTVGHMALLHACADRAELNLEENFCVGTTKTVFDHFCGVGMLASSSRRT